MQEPLFTRPETPPRVQKIAGESDRKTKAYHRGASQRMNSPHTGPPESYRPGTQNYNDWRHGWLDVHELQITIDQAKQKAADSGVLEAQQAVLQLIKSRPLYPGEIRFHLHTLQQSGQLINQISAACIEQLLGQLIQLEE